MNKKYWAIWIIVNLIMGAGGYVFLGIGYIIGLANAGDNPGIVYGALAIAVFILLVLIHFANRILCRVFSEGSGKTIPGTVQLGGNLLAWAIVIVVYLVFTFM